MGYSTFLIDLDHTLFDSDTSESLAFRRAFDAAGIKDAERCLAAFRRINLELWTTVERGEATPDFVRNRRFERLADECGLDADPLVMSDAYVEGLGAFGELYDNALVVLDELARHASLGLVTNGLGEVQRMRIDRTGIAAHFDAIVISAEVGVSKPHGGIFDIAFRALGWPDKAAAVMVGDNLVSDIRGGADYGIATCWYNPGRRAVADGTRFDHEITALAGLLDHLERG